MPEPGKVVVGLVHVTEVKLEEVGVQVTIDKSGKRSDTLISARTVLKPIPVRVIELGMVLGP